MESADRIPFFELLDANCEAINMRAPLTAGAKVLLWEDLERYHFDIIRAALAAHRQDPERGQWQPNTAHVEYQINRHRRNAWVGSDEAWATLPRDPGAPGLLNQVTAAALAIVAPLLDQPRPDVTAARMAFRDAYNSRVEQAKLRREAPKWWVSPAGSLEAQNSVREEGVRLGLLGKDWSPAGAPLLDYTQPTAGQRAILAAYRPKIIPGSGIE